MSINPPPEQSNGLLHGLEMALKRDSIVQAVWSVGGVARRLDQWIASYVFATLNVGTLTATDIDTTTLDATGALTADTIEATTSIETVDLVVTGSATLPGGSGGVTYTVSGSAQALNTNGDAITVPANTTVVRVTTSGGITGILLPTGSDGQLLVVLNESTTSFTYASGEVQAASTFVHPAETALYLIWNSATSLWHRNAT